MFEPLAASGRASPRGVEHSPVNVSQKQAQACKVPEAADHINWAERAFLKARDKRVIFRTVQLLVTAELHKPLFRDVLQ